MKYIYIACISAATIFLYNPDKIPSGTTPWWVGLYLFLLFNFIFSLLALSKRAKTPLLACLFLLSAVTGYYTSSFQLEMTPDIIGACLETSFFEAKEFLEPKLLLWLLMAGAMSFVSSRALSGIRITKKYLGYLGLLCALLAGTYQCLNSSYFKEHYDNERLLTHFENITPFNSVNAFFGYLENASAIDELGKIENTARLDANRTQQVPLDVIFVLGESARADHFGLNGYHRNTTPKLAQEKNAVSFSDVTSFAANTRRSVPVMITEADSEQPEVTSSSFLNIFQKLGFETFWFSLNDKFDRHSNPITRTLVGVDNLYFRSFFNVEYKTAQDHMMLPALEKVLQDTPNKSHFVVLHTRGSHWAYKNRYAQKFRKWTPDTSSTSDMQGLINSYDNSILMTDDLIYRTIELVRNRNALVLYCSDHGESLGEDGVFNHGNPDRPEQRKVPLIVWFSKKYAQNSPRQVANLRANKDLPISHDYIFHSLLSLASIEYQRHRPELDLSSSTMLVGHGSLKKALARR